MNLGRYVSESVLFKVLNNDDKKMKSTNYTVNQLDGQKHISQKKGIESLPQTLIF